MSKPIDLLFRKRFHGNEDPREGDCRDEYERDKARVIHSAAFRRLQAKTQVLGTGEGDYHRTRLTHSIEAGQIGEGLLLTLRQKNKNDAAIEEWLPSPSLMVAACFAHDLGHPPFGHGGERALFKKMVGHGGFEGNGQTLRILVKLEKYRRYEGINPARRTILSVLKYPVRYSAFDESTHEANGKPPKCYYDTEKSVVEWALQPFRDNERDLFVTTCKDDNKDGKPVHKPVHKTLDASIIECADDIAYAVHDLEDIVARQFIQVHDLEEQLEDLFPGASAIGHQEKRISRDRFLKDLFRGYGVRKQLISDLANLFITEVSIRDLSQDFEHPLLRYRITLPPELKSFLESLQKLTRNLVVSKAAVRQLERRGQRIVESLFDELSKDPERMIPTSSWTDLDDKDSTNRRVCDYIAGMTDTYAERIYHRLFTPGYGSSRDEL